MWKRPRFISFANLVPKRRGYSLSVVQGSGSWRFCNNLQCEYSDAHAFGLWGTLKARTGKISKEHCPCISSFPGHQHKHPRKVQHPALCKTWWRTSGWLGCCSKGCWPLGIFLPSHASRFFASTPGMRDTSYGDDDNSLGTLQISFIAGCLSLRLLEEPYLMGCHVTAVYCYSRLYYIRIKYADYIYTYKLRRSSSHQYGCSDNFEISFCWQAS